MELLIRCQQKWPISEIEAKRILVMQQVKYQNEGIRGIHKPFPILIPKY